MTYHEDDVDDFRASRPPSIEEDPQVQRDIEESLRGAPPSWPRDPDTDEPLDPWDFS